MKVDKGRGSEVQRFTACDLKANDDGGCPELNRANVFPLRCNKLIPGQKLDASVTVRVSDCEKNDVGDKSTIIINSLCKKWTFYKL